MALEDEVASVLLRARLLEKALHGNESWELHYSGQRRSTTPQIQEHGVLFEATFIAVAGETTVILICNGISVLYTSIVEARPWPGDVMEVSWTLGMGTFCRT